MLERSPIVMQIIKEKLDIDEDKKDTFNSMNKVIEQTKKVMEMQPKIQKVYITVDEYAKSYKYLKKKMRISRRNLNT